MKIKPGRQKYSTPIEVGTAYNVNTNDDKSVDEKIDTYLGDRRKRLLDEAKLAELAHVAENEKTEAARSRKERELLESGKLSPVGKEEDMEDTEKKIQDAAEVAAEAASAGVEPEDATALGTGKAKVVIIKPKSGGEIPEEGKGGWSVIDGKPVKDTEGEYTFNQALKVAAVEKAKGSNDPLAIFKWMKEEGLLTGGKGDDFMSKFMAELAHKSVESLVGGKPGSGEASVAETLRSEMADLRRELRDATDPVASARRVKEVFDGFKGMGLIPEPSPGGASIDELKVKYGHVEKMEELRADREHKERLVDITADLPERIGRGIGEDIRRSRGKERSPSRSPSSTLDKIKCEECGTEFVVPPEAMEKGVAICPKCGETYRGER